MYRLSPSQPSPNLPQTLSDYEYVLPAERIAKWPPARRSESRLLVVRSGGLEDGRFADLRDVIPERAVLVLNDTRVIPARVSARKTTGGAVEILLLEALREDGHEQADSRLWSAWLRCSKPARPGMRLAVLDRHGEPTAIEAVVQERAGERCWIVRFSEAPDAWITRFGEVPLPPYIGRDASADDVARYQTVYARVPGAVAAPTAGLHFTSELLLALKQQGVDVAFLTLHVGPGTFAPVVASDLDRHQMHEERYEIPERTASLIASGRPVVAVGTTVVRAIEASGGRAGTGRTDLFIRPGFRFRRVDHLITNFHLPRSTLLMLVCAFAGRERILAAYRHAVAAEYRFFSYGDAMWLSRLDA